MIRRFVVTLVLALPLILAFSPSRVAAEEEGGSPLVPGARMEWSGADGGTKRCSLVIPKSGLYRIDAERTYPEDGDSLARVAIVTGDEDETPVYDYLLDGVDRAFVFYPVLDAGNYRVRIETTGSDPDAKYALGLTGPTTLKLGPEERTQAREALDRAVSWLLSSSPPDHEEERYVVAGESLVLMALAEGKAGAERVPLLDRKYVAWLDGRLAPVDGGEWSGQPVRALAGQEMYEQAIAALGLATAARAGSRPAAAAGRELAIYLMAAQAGPSRPAAWEGPTASDLPHYGGWRYSHLEDSADISVSGWCVVALLALDDAGVRVPGMAESVELATKFVLRCGIGPGFAYAPLDHANLTRDSIGLLICLLCGEESTSLAAAMQQIDRHLPDGTQVPEGEHPFYYWYYATRANWLRGRDAWETWRTAMARQLLRRQRDDGSWAGIRGERGMDRYATALGVEILRMCLDEVPHYLKAEVRGF